MTLSDVGLSGRERTAPLVLDAVFAPSALADASTIAVAALNRYLNSTVVAGLELRPPGELQAAARALMRTCQSDGSLDRQRFAQIIDLYLNTGIHLRSTSYMARQFSSVVPVTGVFDMVTAMAPQPASFYEAGQLANVADKIMAEEFGNLLNWAPGTFDMISTSGGTLANLTAVLAARNSYCERAWSQGRSVGRLGIAVGQDAHYSVSRAAGVLGLSDSATIILPVNDRRQIDMVEAIKAIEAARADGLEVFAIVAAAGSTPVGAIDPLVELAEYARRSGIWLHVDAAHNGAFLVSDRLRWRVGGLELADSFCLDAHKTLFVPAAATLLFYRDPSAARRAFIQEASYVFDDPGDEMTEFESGAKNLECTKRPAILNLWLVWALYGPEVLAAKLEYLVDLTSAAHDLIDSQPDFQVMHEPESNILCFAYRPAKMGAAQSSALQLAIRDRIRAEGRFLISKVELDGCNVLRLVLMNHKIELRHVGDLLDEIRRVATAITEGR